jgi:uncharacterized protein YbjT (DUF2867 family)
MAAAETILVVGGTGRLGEPVARRLRADGFRVRLLVRDEAAARAHFGGDDFEYVQGTIEDADAVESAIAGCSGVHVSVGAHTVDQFDEVEHRGTARVADAAARAGVSRLSYVSGSLVHEDYGEKIPEHRAKLAAEDAIRRSGVPFVFYRPSYFMENIPEQIQGKRAVILGKIGAWHMVAADDFARMVSRAFRVPEAANKELYVFGPEPITPREALELYTSIVEPGKKISTMPLGVMSVVDRLFMGRKLRPVLDIMSVMQRVGERGDPTEANELLGAPTTTVREWCERRAAAAA